MSQEQLRKFEFNCVMQDVHKKDKGSKSYKQPHTAFTVLTRPITNGEMDALVYGGVYGFKAKLVIEVIQDPNPVIPRHESKDNPPQTSKESSS